MSDKPGRKRQPDDEFYGKLNHRNIGRVVFGSREFDTWYGNAAYFAAGSERLVLGYEYANRVAEDPSSRKRKSSAIADSSEVWIDKLHVCNYCFKYTLHATEMASHRAKCPLRVPLPVIGQMHYRDDVSRMVIRQVRGFQHPLFCQDLALFGKLFLEDKSVFYNVDNFDFYVLYGRDNTPSENNTSTTNNGNANNTNVNKRRLQSKTVLASPYSDDDDSEYLVPLGFFSKEVLSWEPAVNLACICVFPIFQRRHLGSLLIEFLYELSRREYKQVVSGPEYPLSPFGKVTYLRFWSKKLAHILTDTYSSQNHVSLDELSKISCFRKEDILLTMDYMGLLTRELDSEKGSETDISITIHLGNLRQWCENIAYDPRKYRGMLNLDCLLI